MKNTTSKKKFPTCTTILCSAYCMPADFYSTYLILIFGRILLILITPFVRKEKV